MSNFFINFCILRFIGFTYSYPSRYLQRIYSKIDEHAYVSWRSKKQSTPEPYRSIIKTFTNEELKRPYWGKEYAQTITKTGSRTDLQVRDHLSKDFEQAKDFIGHDWDKIFKLNTSNKIEFGKKQEIFYSFKEDHYVILGLYSKFLKLVTKN